MASLRSGRRDSSSASAPTVSPDAPAKTAEDAARTEQALRSRWDQTQSTLRARFEQPIERATKITQVTLGWFPVRVWRHFLQHNGFLLAAGVSYQALFAIFAAIYVAFAIVGLWLGGSPEAIQALITAINSYIPGLISDDGSGLFTTEQVTEIATGNTGVLGVTGVIALGTFMWTAIGFMTFTRRAVRDIFGIIPDQRAYIMLKSLDLLAATTFGVALLLGSAMTAASTWAVGLVFSLLGLSTHSPLYQALLIGATVIVSFALYGLALAALVKFLTGTTLKWRSVWVGALLGGAALTILQLGAGWLLAYTPSNPLLATFAIFVGLLLWFRIVGVIILVAAAWIAVTAYDENLPLIHRTEAERIAAEHAALLTAAHVRLRTARDARAQAPWFRVWSADRAVHEAERELAEVEAATPPSPSRGSLFE